MKINSFLGYISGSTLTVTSVLSGTVGTGQLFNNSGLLSVAVSVTGQTGGTTGGAGTYSLSNSSNGSVGSSGSPVAFSTHPLWPLIGSGGSAIANPDSPIAFAECYTFTTSTGAAYRWTSYDQPIPYGGYVFSASGPLVQGLKSKANVGLEVDRQQIQISATPAMLINGAPFLIALRDGAFDGAAVQRDRVFMSSPGGSVVGGVTMFKGFISTVDQVGRTMATVTIASALVILDYDMPRNLFSPTCIHSLYDAGCGVPRGTFGASGTAASGSNASTVVWSGAVAGHRGGSLVWTSGANANVRSTVKSVSAGASLGLMYPLPFAPTVGDAFTVYYGCDHTQSTCQNVFGNLANFRGFPYVPPPEMAY
ncbi:putative phage protein (TIGR02218 family) [Roseiarcus fermentans]|uniref:Putative phage protein (TIGR02218 family) n=1 Tax=Roseiarcus fermentans TaxID=1473586 RepID=A0A366EN22_9HYPH|nr:DUF2163 domain-containing protein [Roseiarcus fermentans]RBP03798.1 putative phage protein (TIGR02218 family) [Roseiarcus fermentans]